MLRIAIVEDEKKIAEAMEAIIKEVAPDCMIVGKADSIESGIKLFSSTEVDFAFFDVELKDGLSFELLQQLKNVNFQLVFVTAHSHYAIDAFRFSALDYIVKPVDKESVLRAINRGKNNIAQKTSENIQLLLENLNKNNANKKIILQTAETNHYVEIKDIVRCEAENNYCNIILNQGNKILVSRPLKEYEQLLPCTDFFRIHQSHLVNLNYISQIKKRMCQVVLSTGDMIPLASRRKDELISLMKNRD